MAELREEHSRGAADSARLAPSDESFTFGYLLLSEGAVVSSDEWRGRTPRWASATCLEKVKLPAERVLHIDHLFARMQRLDTYEAKTNAKTRIGSNLSQILPPPFSCE